MSCMGVLSLCCFWSAVSTVQSAVEFDSTFLFEAPPLFAWVTLRARLCHIDDPQYQLPLIFTLHALGAWLWDIRIFKIFTTRLSLFNEYEIYGITYEYIYAHTYIHTYIQTPLAFNTLMWGSLRLAPINYYPSYMHTPGTEGTLIEVYKMYHLNWAFVQHYCI